jgi:hypothetical protein
VGAVVAIYGSDPVTVAYEVEFVSRDGVTLGVVTLTDSDIEPV